MKQRYYCSNCGKLLSVYKKVIKGHIITLVDHHECSEEPQELDLEPVEIPQFVIGEKGKFVQKLNDLHPRAVAEGSDFELRDKRPKDQVISTAPETILKSMQGMHSSTPAHDPKGLDEDEQ